MRIKNRIASRLAPRELFDVRFSRAEKESLRTLAHSHSLSSKRRCVNYLWWNADVPGNRSFAIEIALHLVPVPDDRVRWGALTMAGQLAEAHPKIVWPMVARFGRAKDGDIRLGVACCVLEHVLESHFEKYLPRAMRLALRDPRFEETLGFCARWLKFTIRHRAKPLFNFLEKSSARADRAVRLEGRLGGEERRSPGQRL